MSRDHRRLVAFQKADALVIAVYGMTRTFPDEERFGLTSQMRRAAVSIPANVVEGCARQTTKDYLHFLRVAHGSSRELGYFVDLAHRLGYSQGESASEVAELSDEVSRTLSGLIRSLDGVKS